MVTTGSGREAPLPARWPIVTETVWFTRSFSPFSDAGEPPPFDHHGGYPFDKAMWAPWEVAAL
jgi:hypothetical protein